MNKSISYIVACFIFVFQISALSQTILDFQRTTFTGTYLSVTGTPGPTGDDWAENYSLPFQFYYIDHYYDQVRICTNGWIELGSTSRPLSFSNNLAGEDLFSSIEPNKTLAPWWADLGAFNNPVEYSTQGTSPNRVYIVQWRDVNAPYSSSRLINFQVRLYETSNIIEFWYGIVSRGGDYEHASFGIKDEIGGSGHFIDGPTGSNTMGTYWLNSLQHWPAVFYRFLTAPVTVVRPNGGEFFSIGYPDTIKWSSTVDNVKLEYSTNSGSGWIVIENSVPASSGKYTWTQVPNTPSQTALVRISDAGNASVFDISDNVFVISEPPVISVSSDSFAVVLNEGDSLQSIMQISNTGLGNLNYEISIENLSFNKKEKRNNVISYSTAEWKNKFLEGQKYGDKNFTRTANIRSFNREVLPLIISDPAGDAEFVDITQIRGRSTDENIELEFIFETELNPFDFGGNLGLDTDQDIFTGVPSPFGLSTQEVGCEYFVSFFSLGSNLIDVYDQFFSYLGSFSADWDARSFRFSVPLSILNNDDGVINIAAVVGNYSSPTDWIPDEGYGILGGNLWLTLEPLSGTIMPGNNENIAVRFNTSRLDGGEFYANILISSNDPVNSQVTIPVHLTVIGQPNLACIDSVNFDQVYVGYPETKYIELKNDGSVTLNITAINSSNSLFTLTSTNFNILPDDTEQLGVTFNPSGAGFENGTLSLISNDPTSPEIINLYGEGLFPPVISVTPDSFFYDLNVGDSTVTELIIDNSNGLGELVFQISDRLVSGRISEKTNHKHIRNRISSGGKDNILGIDLANIPNVTQLSKPQTGILNTFVPDNPMMLLPLIISDIIGDGGIADIKEIRGHVLNNNLEIEYVFADGINISDSLIAVLYLDIDRNPLTGSSDPFYYHDLGVDYFIDYFPLWLGNDIIIVEALTGNYYNVPYNINGTTLSYSIPLSILGNDDGEMDLLALSEHNNYSDPLDWAPDEGHVTLLTDVSWLGQTPALGVVPPGGSVILEILANTSELIGGNYLAMINISSNDPANPVLEVPFAMHLTGVPQITFSPDSLNFGQTYIGYSKSLSFSVSSTGTDSLFGTITSVSSEFVLVDSVFALPVGSNKNIEVQFHPADTGFIAATLMITSNAGIGPLNVYLSGMGLIAPNILTDTTSFSFAANTDDTLTSGLTIFNSGGSDLHVEIHDEIVSRQAERLFGCGNNMIYEISPDDGSVINSFPTPVYTDYVGLAFSGEYLFLTSPAYSPNIFVLNPQTGSVVNSYPIQSYCDGLAYIHPYLYALNNNFYPANVDVLNPLNGNLVRSITPAVTIYGGLDGGDDRLFASDSYLIFELNLQNGFVINSFSAFNSVDGIGFTGERLFTSISWAGIDEYDPNTGQYIRTISSMGYSALAGGSNKDAEWLIENPQAVTIPAGGSVVVNLSVITNQLQMGQYHAEIILESNDPDYALLNIPVTLDIITGVDNQEEIPKSYSLYQNYPNPFNPSTTISYDLPKQSRVVLKIFNILGEEITTLVNHEQNAGRYKISFSLPSLASGIYIYHLDAGDFSDTKKLILMK